MDDTKRPARLISNAIVLGLLWAAAGVLVVASAPGAHADVDYVSPAQITTLTAQFDTARLEDPAAVTRFAWICDMYGVNTKLQVRRDQKLYAFKSDDAVHSFVNTGDEPIGAYRVANGTLEGHGQKDVLDQVRLMKDGRLISKLSVPSRGITVAFAVCTGS